MSVYAWFTRPGPSGFGYSSTAEDVTAGLDLRGKRILVTGCGSGLGLETARVLGLRGATVIAAARSKDQAAAACAPFAGTFEPVACDLSEPASIRACVAAVQGPLDAIIANAGVMALAGRELKYGHELQFLTNHLGHFQLVTGLLPRLSPTARVVILSSNAHRRAPPGGIVFDDITGNGWYDPWAAYGQSKLANLLFVRELATRLPAGQTANALHPGVISTNLGRHLGAGMRIGLTVGAWLAFKTVPQGAATQTYVATNPGVGATTGEYWSDCNVAESNELGRDRALARKLWEHTEAWVAALGSAGGSAAG